MRVGDPAISLIFLSLVESADPAIDVAEGSNDRARGPRSEVSPVQGTQPYRLPTPADTGATTAHATVAAHGASAPR